ncbi:MAG: adenosylmethionine decarboxylase [Parcubacteria group bacterium]|nr:adenosylmethionine decarboxylase [Parcubacteria group bacterium]
MNEHFGEHITLDGYGGNEGLLDDKQLVRKCLEELPGLLGMKKLSDPEVYRAEDNGKKDPGGYTGVVIIDESHISIHTFPKRGFVSIDVYTCKNGLDKDFITNYFKQKFDLQEVETNFIKRGLKYPPKNIY